MSRNLSSFKSLSSFTIPEYLIVTCCRKPVIYLLQGILLHGASLFYNSDLACLISVTHVCSVSLGVTSASQPDMLQQQLISQQSQHLLPQQQSQQQLLQLQQQAISQMNAEQHLNMPPSNHIQGGL